MTHSNVPFIHLHVTFALLFTGDILGGNQPVAASSPNSGSGVAVGSETGMDPAVPSSIKSPLLDSSAAAQPSQQVNPTSPLETKGQSTTPDKTVCKSSQYLVTYIEHRYRKLHKKTRKCFESGKYIPSDISDLVTRILNWKDITSIEFGIISYATTQILDFFCTFSSDESFETQLQVIV